MPVRILSDETVNKIAAGEVVERPANVIKELLENSLDADSSVINISVEKSGKELILIKDNGRGMSKSDLTLALNRHATSKMFEFEDLESLDSYGFRGEALPSIASVSDFTIKSQTKDKDVSGWELHLTGGKNVSGKSWSGSRGTIAEIRNLFFNTPARKKFLKSDSTEKKKIIRILEELALANHSCAFYADFDSKTMLSAPATKNVMERVMDVLGRESAGNLVKAAISTPLISIEAFITPVEQSLTNRNLQFLFVNRRPVNLSRMITHSIYEAYRERLPSRRHPGIILFITVNPKEIDVNIHPTKRDVKFSKESEIHDIVFRTLKNALMKPANLTTPYSASKSENEEAPSLVSDTNMDFLNSTFTSEYLYNSQHKKPNPAENGYSSQINHDALGIAFKAKTDFKYIGQIFATYILARNSDELFIIDQHAACERIMYERYKAQAESKTIPVQKLMIPYIFELSFGESSILTENLESLNSAGWMVENFGKNTFKVSEIPAVLNKKSEIKDLFGSIIESVNFSKKMPSNDKITNIMRAACRASAKAGDTFSYEEADKLFEDLFACENPYTCPHGRPTMIKISKHELEKKFERT